MISLVNPEKFWKSCLQHKFAALQSTRDRQVTPASLSPRLPPQGSHPLYSRDTRNTFAGAAESDNRSCYRHRGSSNVPATHRASPAHVSHTDEKYAAHLRERMARRWASRHHSAALYKSQPCGRARQTSHQDAGTSHSIPPL